MVRLTIVADLMFDVLAFEIKSVFLRVLKTETLNGLF